MFYNIFCFFVQECSKRANYGKFTLRDLLVVPMQRVLKYHLLLQVTHPLLLLCVTKAEAFLLMLMLADVFCLFIVLA